MIRCTAITKGDQQCDSFFCWKCLSDNYCESPEMLGQTQGAYVTADGRKITLAAGMDVTWACPKCRYDGVWVYILLAHGTILIPVNRDICTCKACTKVREERENSGSRSIMNSFVRQQKVTYLPFSACFVQHLLIQLFYIRGLFCCIWKRMSAWTRRHQL
jgi:hypothetical protein